MLDGLYAYTQGGFIVARQDRYFSLGDDRAGVQFFGHKVYAAAMPRVAGFQGAAMGMQSPVLGQQGRMDVQQPAAIVPDELGPKDAHETRQHHQPGVVPVYGLRQRRGRPAGR